MRKWWWWLRIVFVVWLTEEKRLALFPAETIARNPHHRESQIRDEQDNIANGNFWSKSSLIRNLLNVKHHAPYKSIYLKYNIIKIIGKLFSKNELLFLGQVNSNSDPSQILSPQFPISGDSLPPSLYMSYFILANWNPSSMQSSSCSLLVSIFFPTPSDHTLSQLLEKLNHTPSQVNQSFHQAIRRSQYLMGQTHYPSKSWVFIRRFPLKVRQYGQQQLYLHYKVCWVLYKIVGAPSFLQP